MRIHRTVRGMLEKVMDRTGMLENKQDRNVREYTESEF